MSDETEILANAALNTAGRAVALAAELKLRLDEFPPVLDIAQQALAEAQAARADVDAAIGVSIGKYGDEAKARLTAMEQNIGDCQATVAAIAINATEAREAVQKLRDDIEAWKRTQVEAFANATTARRVTFTAPSYLWHGQHALGIPRLDVYVEVNGSLEVANHRARITVRPTEFFVEFNEMVSGVVLVS